jgi:hypothetical protein
MCRPYRDTNTPDIQLHACPCTRLEDRVLTLRRSQYSQSRPEGEWGVSSYSSLGALESIVMLPRDSRWIEYCDRVDFMQPTLIEWNVFQPICRRTTERVILGTTFHSVPFSQGERFALHKGP